MFKKYIYEYIYKYIYIEFGSQEEKINYDYVEGSIVMRQVQEGFGSF